MAPVLSASDEEILVEFIAMHPELWDFSHLQYKNQRLKDTLWNELAEKIGKSVDDCRKRWRNIRDTYDRKKNKRTGSAAPPLKRGRQWALEDKLAFLQTTYEHRRSFSNVVEEEIFKPIMIQTLSSPQPELLSVDCDLPIISPCSFTPTLPQDIPMQSVPFQDTLTIPSTSSTPSPAETSYAHKPKNLTIPSTSSTPSTAETFADKKSKNRAQAIEKAEKREKERNAILEKLVGEDINNDVDLFFRSFALKVKRLPEESQFSIQLKVMEVLNNERKKLREGLEPDNPL